MKHATFLLLFIFLTAQLTSAESTSEAEMAKMIQASLIIKDNATACQDAYKALLQHPQSQPLSELYIQTLAKTGQLQPMMQAWQQYEKTFPDPYDNTALLEEMAWGVIFKGSNSSSPLLRAMSVIGAFYGQDEKGVTVLHKHLYDNNSLVRAVTVKLASRLRDAALCDSIVQLLKEERVWRVRLEVIKAAGQMKIHAVKPELLAIIADNRTHAEEKAAAIQALVTLLDQIGDEEVKKLAQSDRVGLRLLACEAIAYFHKKSCLNFLLPLLKDPNSEVRIAALQTIGRMRVNNIEDKPIVEIAAAMLQDHDHRVAITSAWLLTLHDTALGQQAFIPWINHQNRETRRYAAGALGGTGKYGAPLMLFYLKQHSDPLIRINLALALMGQRVAVGEACDEVYNSFILDKDRWMWQDFGIFRLLAPNTTRFCEAGIEDPEAINQSVRLDILNIMAVMKYNKAQEAISHFLQQKSWGICGSASALLLTECDESALVLVMNMLDDPRYTIRIQAALILSMWGRDEKAITVLQDAYSSADRRLKEKILEGVGGIGAKSSVPFLVEKLGEPYQALSIIAASSLLQCLYH